MRLDKLFFLLVLSTAGCLSPLTRRLDTTNEQLLLTNHHLAAINEKMQEANARMIEMNQHLLATNAKLSETNQRLQSIEKGLPRFPRLGAADPPIRPLAKRPEEGE